MIATISLSSFSCGKGTGFLLKSPQWTVQRFIHLGILSLCTGGAARQKTDLSHLQGVETYLGDELTGR